MDRVNVFIIDDSAVVRKVLTEVLAADPGLRVLGAASDPIFAMQKMQSKWPDVIVLDLEMPRMDGITFLRKIMKERPTPVVICSTLTEGGADATMQAVAAGAAEIVAKPKMGLKAFLQDERARLLGAVKAAARADPNKLRPKKTARKAAPLPKQSAEVILPAAHGTGVRTTTERVVAVGTSTGGTQALERVLTALPRVAPAIAVVQHMPERFTQAFAERLNKLCEVEVREAAHGDRLVPGRVLIAPGGRHMLLRRSGAQYHVDVVDGPVVNRHRPSVDVLFRSAANCAGGNALGIIMTGMGDDGAIGIEEMHEAGSHTIAQDEASCVVFGMPKEAIKRGAIDDVVSLDDIAREILRFGQTK